MLDPCAFNMGETPYKIPFITILVTTNKKPRVAISAIKEMLPVRIYFSRGWMSERKAFRFIQKAKAPMAPPDKQQQHRHRRPDDLVEAQGFGDKYLLSIDNDLGNSARSRFRGPVIC